LYRTNTRLQNKQSKNKNTVSYCELIINTGYIENKLMLHKAQLIIGILLPLLSACTAPITQPITPYNEPIAAKVAIDPLIKQELLGTNNLSAWKMGKALQLVRIMEGGACKNKQQGAFGLFKLYANLDDIERIKQTQGAEIFADFELSIQDFAMLAWQQAVNRLDFKLAKNSQNKNHNQEQQVTSLTLLFTDLVANDIQAFEAKTRLTINLIPDTDSLVIYPDGCQIPHAH